MNTFYLIRHGQDFDNSEGLLNGHRDRTLTEIGINQAIELARKIKINKLKADFVLSSPLNRALTTASIVASLNGYPTPIIEPLLIERDFGIMTGKKHSEIIPTCSPNIIKTDTATYFLNPQGSETFPDLLSRANLLFSKLNSKYQNKHIIFVSHGDFGKIIYAAYYKLDWQNVLKSFHFGNSELLVLSPDINPKDSKLINIKQYNV